MVTARPLFVGGTSSNAGKSWMVTAICAWLRRQGVRVAPFKAQNMSNHSCACPGSGEIGRAQAAQAEACGLEPEIAMNPILLKPNGHGASQVVVHGRVWKTLTAREYYAHSDEMRAHVRRAYDDLARRADVIVIEGAGSVTELNLRPHDIVNLDLVVRLRAPWVLVADIERGGVFASVVGTARLLNDDELSLFRGFLINKFRGDQSLFDEGARDLGRLIDRPCLGVFPYAPDVYVDAEDSLAVDTRVRTPPPAGARIAIVRLPHLSNATDFRLLTWADWLTSPSDTRYDFIVIPGTKNTIADLAWLRETGLAGWIANAHRAGAVVIGVCGGYQMLGRVVADPDGVESATAEAPGLGILPVSTRLTPDKRVRPVHAVTPAGTSFDAYEIHAGVTSIESSTWAPFAELQDGSHDGVRAARAIGTYLHGALEDPRVCAEVFGVVPPPAVSKADHYARLADWFDAHARGFAEAVGL